MYAADQKIIFFIIYISFMIGKLVVNGPLILCLWSV